MTDNAAIALEELQKRLDEALDPLRVKKREGGGGRTLSYLEGHDAIRAANTIFGYGGWSMDAREIVHLGTEPFVTKAGKQGIRVGYRATVRVEVPALGCFYADTGYGDAIEYTGSELSPHELASKEAVTDGLKRCLMHLGDQFGLCLYDKDAPEHKRAARRAVSHPNAVQPPAPSSLGPQSWEDVQAALSLHVDMEQEWLKAACLAHYGTDTASLDAPSKQDFLRRSILVCNLLVEDGGPEGEERVRGAFAAGFDGAALDVKYAPPTPF